MRTSVLQPFVVHVYRALVHPIARLALCTRRILANSSIDQRAQLQIAVERFAVLDFRRSPPIPRLQSDALSTTSDC